MKVLSDIKKDMVFNRHLSSLIETLKAIAVSQYKSLEHRISTYENLLLTAENFLEFINIKDVNHVFLNPKHNKQAVIAVTTDVGFLGGLNMKVVSRAIAELENMPGKLIIIGERGKNYANDLGVPFAAFTGINDESRYEQAMELRDYIINEILKGSVGYLKAVYPRPVTFTTQVVEAVSFIPFLPASAKNPLPSASDVLIESRPADIVEYLVGIWMGQKLYEIFGLSRLAEFSARYVHLEDCSQKLKDIDKKTQLQYFRAQHEIIDRNMRELFAARSVFGGA